MEAQRSSKPKVFISYSHKDEEWKDRLLSHLQVASREGDFEVWNDRRIQAGDEWHQEITRAIDGATIAILLISTDFLNSSFIREEEVPRLLQEREKRGLRLFPVILRPCLWDRIDWLTRIQARPLDGTPLALRKGTLETELVKIAKEVWTLVEEEVSRRIREFLATYRRRLESKYSRWDLGSLGVAQTGGAARPIEASLDDMYLPLRLGPEFNLSDTESGEIIESQALLDRQRPLAIRGSAGAGKTTWMRWTFRQLLRIESAVPLMVVLRDLARKWQDPNCRGADRTLDVFLEGWIDEHVPEREVRLPEFLTLKNGPRPVLLVDGWDELGPLGEELRSKLMGFLSQYPRVLAVVTSRPYGEGRPSHAERFDVLDIQPLSDQDIAALSARFFAHCYGSEQAAIQREVDRFERALERSLEAKSLARTALLLTMMLFISRSRPLPDKRHLLYEACVDNLLTALPDRKEEEGALLLREQWRPPDSEERMRVVAALAASLQEAGYKKSSRSRIVRNWDELAALLPDDWQQSRRIGFLAWLAGPAGLLTDQSDGTVAFAHLSFQEFLTAWQLNATTEGREERIKIFLERIDNPDWWETLRLWSALIERHSRDRLDSVLAAISEANDRGLSFVGSVLADGLGTEHRFEDWLSRFLTRLTSYWPGGVELCARAWSASRQEERQKTFATRLSEKAMFQNWLTWQRYHHFFGESSLPGKLSMPTAYLNRCLIDQIGGGEVEDTAQVAAGRILAGGPGIWPANPLKIGLLQVWPSNRRLAGLRLQFAQTCGADLRSLSSLGIPALIASVGDDRSRDLARKADHYLARDSDRYSRDWAHDPDRNWARYWIRDLARYLASSFTKDFAIEGQRDWAQDLARYVNLYWTRDWACKWDRALARDWAREWTRDLACDWNHVFSSESRIEPRNALGLDFVLGELFSFGRSSARFILSQHNEQRVDSPEMSLLSEACRLSFQPTSQSRRFEKALERYSPANDPLWPALARHLARCSTSEDRALLIDLAQHPEKREPPLSWGLQFIVRGDVMLDDGSVVTLDELSDELGLPHLPYLDDIPDELEVDWAKKEQDDLREL